MSEFLLRPVAPPDCPQIAAIYAEAVVNGTASFELEPPTEAEMARRIATLLELKYPYVVAEIEGTIAGYGYAGPYRTRPAYRWSVENSVYVHPDYHRRGLGRQLLGWLIEVSTRAGFRQMVAIIGDSAHTASIELHRQMGFRPVGTLTDIGFKHGRWLDSVILQLALGDGAETLPDPGWRPGGR